MQYHIWHQQLCIFNIHKCHFDRIRRSTVTLVQKYFHLSCLSFFTSRKLSKLRLALIPFVLLLYPFYTQALSAKTANAIEGSAPYLTLDEGKIKSTTTDNLLSITLSDGTTITPATNTSTFTHPIVLPRNSESFADIKMFAPINRDFQEPDYDDEDYWDEDKENGVIRMDTIALSTLINAPYEYGRDDDGDGQGENSIVANGNLSLRIVDKHDNVVSPTESLTICRAPYKVMLISNNASLTTRYGIPNSTIFNNSTVTYYINPKPEPQICYATPSLIYGTKRTKYKPLGDFSSQSDYTWNPHKGFLRQAIWPRDYGLNFPTTGADGLYFDLQMGGTGNLKWFVVTQGSITAEIIDGGHTLGSIRIKLHGPKPTESQKQMTKPGSVAIPKLPQTFELVGYDSEGKEMLKYGFVIKQWFINRGAQNAINHSQAYQWCYNAGYRLPEVKDLTNANCNFEEPCKRAVGAKPRSTGNNYQREIGAGFISEWGFLFQYNFQGNTDFTEKGIWTKDFNTSEYPDRVTAYIVNSDTGSVFWDYDDKSASTICVTGSQ